MCSTCRQLLGTTVLVRKRGSAYHVEGCSLTGPLEAFLDDPYEGRVLDVGLANSYRPCTCADAIVRERGLGVDSEL